MEFRGTGATRGAHVSALPCGVLVKDSFPARRLLSANKRLGQIGLPPRLCTREAAFRSLAAQPLASEANADPEWRPRQIPGDAKWIGGLSAEAGPNGP